MERLFEHKQLEDHTRFSYATLKLTRYASLWFDHFNRGVKLKVNHLETWTGLKAKLKKQFVPITHKKDLFLKLNSLT